MTRLENGWQIARKVRGECGYVLELEGVQSQKCVWTLWNVFRYLWVVDRTRKRVKTRGNDWGNGEMAGNGAWGQE